MWNLRLYQQFNGKSGILEHNAVSTGKQRLTFWRSLMPPSSGYKQLKNGISEELTDLKTSVIIASCPGIPEFSNPEMTHLIPNKAKSNFIFEQTLQFDPAIITKSLHTKAFMQWLLQTGKGINADIKKHSHSKD